MNKVATKRWIVISVIVALVLIVMPLMTSYAKASGAQKEFDEQITILRTTYDEAYQAEYISAQLNDAVNKFIEKEEAAISFRNSVQVCGDLPDDYICFIYSYSDECREILAQMIMDKVELLYSSEELKEEIKPYLDECNKDMEFLKKELEIYGIKEELIIEETEFPYLNVKG